MAQTFFKSSGPGLSKRLKLHSDVSDAELLDETVIRWRRPAFELPREGEKVRIAAFDLDETLTTTKSGSPFAKHGHDWRLLEHMTQHLDALTRDEHHRTIVVVFTNQGSVVPHQTSRSYVNLLTKVGGVMKELPMISLVYAAAKAPTPGKRARYRKPGPGMFELLKKDLEPGVIDMAVSFYVGDAAGRPGDHSPDDKKFARATGLFFHTPERWLESKHITKCSSSSTDALDSDAKPRGLDSSAVGASGHTTQVANENLCGKTAPDEQLVDRKSSPSEDPVQNKDVTPSTNSTPNKNATPSTNSTPDKSSTTSIEDASPNVNATPGNAPTSN